MKRLLVIILAVGLASADIGLTYKVPDTSYGVPSYQYKNNAEYNTGSAAANGYNYNAGSSANAGYQQNLGQQSGYQYPVPLGLNSNNVGYQQANYQNNIGNQYRQNSGLNSVYNTAPQPSYQYNAASSQGGYQYQSSSEYQSSAAQKSQQFYKNWQQAPAQVFKHFYLHAAPEEPEQPKARQPVALPPPQKHYKIIFIKAPTQTVYQPQYVPVPQPNEEKTIVYVLVKKPEEQQEVAVPKLEQKAPSKPEVFFIKYNNKADSSSVINNIVSDYNKVDTVNFATPGTENQFGSGQIGQYNQAGQNQESYNQIAQNGNENSFSNVPSNAGYSATATADAAASGLNGISTSQGVPHETYGPPKFRV